MALQKQLDMEAAEGGVPVPGMGGTPFVMTAPANVLGRLTCTVAEAKLARLVQLLYVMAPWQIDQLLF